ncbi:hypothetical protein NEIRO03_0566 [Nematocida sp. AWRm78]|nr:hypothetical protein NEIRO03_0566 [Nematocida sp. AWRm78]
MDKISEDWTDDDWKTFMKHMLEHIDKKRKSVLIKPPRIQDFRNVGTRQYQLWADSFAGYVERNGYTHRQVATDMKRYPINYPPEVREMWHATEGDLQAARGELYDLGVLLDKQQAEARTSLGRRPEERRGKSDRRFDTRNGRPKFTGSCNYCHKPGHKEIACRKKGYDTQGPPKGQSKGPAPNS